MLRKKASLLDNVSICRSRKLKLFRSVSVSYFDSREERFFIKERNLLQYFNSVCRTLSSRIGPVSNL